MGKENCKRPTIGLLFDNLYENYGANIWTGVVEYAREADLNLICFSGGSLCSPGAFHSQRNVIYDLVSQENVDGIVAISGSIGNHISHNELERFYSRFSHIPFVSIGVPITGRPSIVVNNELGMRKLMKHLLEDHKYKRLAFVKGPDNNPETEKRFKVFKESLAAHGLSVDPGLIASGAYDRELGRLAVEYLMKSSSNYPEIIVAATDYMAIHIINALKEKGLRVPGDIAVVGFDDIEEAGGMMPAITTVYQPLHELGRQAVKTLSAILKGEKVPGEVNLTTQLVVRRSCGCFSRTGISGFIDQAVPGQGALKGEADAFKKRLFKKLKDLLRESSTGYADEKQLDLWIEQLYNAFYDYLENDPIELFLMPLEQVIVRGLEKGVKTSVWYSVVSSLFSQISGVLKEEKQVCRADKLWKESLVFIGETAERVNNFDRIQGEERAVTLNKINQTLITTFNKMRLKNILIEELPKLGINSCYLSLYTDDKMSRKYAKLLLSYNKENSPAIDDSQRKFVTRKLIPGNIKEIGRRSAYLVMPLYFKTEQLGFVLFEIGPTEAKVYETLAGQLSSALKGAKLVGNRKRLEKEILEISGREQQRIGQDLHDGLGQILTGVAYLCKVMVRQLQSKNLDEAESMQEISDLINQSIAQTRSLARGLVPVELEQNGLISALDELSQKIRDQFKIQCIFECLNDILIKDNSRALHLYRIVQEAVNNALKHSEATCITISFSKQNDIITLAVIDNGVGLPEAAREKKGMGLRIMRYRANMIGARIDVSDNGGKGTGVICSFRESGEAKEAAL